MLHFDAFATLASALLGAIATGLWNKFNNQRVDAGVRRQIHAYAAAIFSDLGFVAKSMRIGRGTSLWFGIESLIGRSRDMDVAIALKPWQSEALYQAVDHLVGLRSLYDESGDEWQVLPTLARDTVYSAVCTLARLLITFGDHFTVASLTPDLVRESPLWTVYVLDPSIIDRASFLLPLVNWAARKGHWKRSPQDPAKIERLRRFLGSKWPAPVIEEVFEKVREPDGERPDNT